MKLLLILQLLCVCALVQARQKRQADDTEVLDDDEKNLISAACVFSCLETNQRKGVDGPLATPTPLDNGCDNLDFRDLLDMCKAYRQVGASSCLTECINSETKNVMMTGLQYVCIDHFTAFEKNTPCFNAQCPALEEECGPRCGSMEDATDEWWNQMTDNHTAFDKEGIFGQPPPPPRALKRRKREKQYAWQRGSTTPNPPDYTDPPQYEGADEESLQGGFMETCKYIGCYLNCSRATMINKCGSEAYELLRYTAEMLFAVLVAPFKPTLTNANITMMVNDGCNGYHHLTNNLTTGALKSGASQPSYCQFWTMASAIFAIASLIKAFF